MITNGHNGPEEEPYSPPAEWTLTQPADKYLQRFNALPVGHPIRAVVTGLEIELASSPLRLATGLESDDPATNQFWYIQSDLDHEPVVRICFEVQGKRVKPLDFWEQHESR